MFIYILISYGVRNKTMCFYVETLNWTTADAEVVFSLWSKI